MRGKTTTGKKLKEKSVYKEKDNRRENLRDSFRRTTPKGHTIIYLVVVENNCVLAIVHHPRNLEANTIVRTNQRLGNEHGSRQRGSSDEKNPHGHLKIHPSRGLVLYTTLASPTSGSRHSSYCSSPKYYISELASRVSASHPSQPRYASTHQRIASLFRLCPSIHRIRLPPKSFTPCPWPHHVYSNLTWPWEYPLIQAYLISWTIATS